MTAPHPESPTRGRVCLILAAVLWSLSGLFTRLLQRDTALGLNTPQLTPLQIAFYRALFAGLVFVPAIHWRKVTFRPLMPVMVVCFAIMNALFLSAMALGPAANAILLQNTAPFWVYLVSIYLLGEAPDRRSVRALLVGMLGIGIIIAGGWQGSETRSEVLAMGLGSGVTYAGVILCLRSLRGEPSQWLVLQNHLGSAFFLSLAIGLISGPLAWWEWVAVPSNRQLAFLAVFGTVQMGLPYFLFARGLRSVGPQEAGMLTLLEPILNPVWAYLIAPDTETPPITTWIGGALILGALAWRYLPRRPTRQMTNDPPAGMTNDPPMTHQ
jgi:drug/metabolite transporter, DME family